MRVLMVLLVLATGVLLGVFLSKGVFGLAALTGVSAIVLAVLFAGFFLARDSLRWARRGRRT